MQLHAGKTKIWNAACVGCAGSLCVGHSTPPLVMHLCAITCCGFMLLHLTEWYASSHDLAIARCLSALDVCRRWCVMVKRSCRSRARATHMALRHGGIGLRSVQADPRRVHARRVSTSKQPGCCGGPGYCGGPGLSPSQHNVLTLAPLQLLGEASCAKNNFCWIARAETCAEEKSLLKICHHRLPAHTSR